MRFAAILVTVAAVFISQISALACSDCPFSCKDPYACHVTNAGQLYFNCECVKFGNPPPTPAPSRYLFRAIYIEQQSSSEGFLRPRFTQHGVLDRKRQGPRKAWIHFYATTNLMNNTVSHDYAAMAMITTFAWMAFKQQLALPTLCFQDLHLSSG